MNLHTRQIDRCRQSDWELCKVKKGIEAEQFFLKSVFIICHVIYFFRCVVVCFPTVLVCLRLVCLLPYITPQRTLFASCGNPRYARTGGNLDVANSLRGRETRPHSGKTNDKRYLLFCPCKIRILRHPGFVCFGDVLHLLPLSIYKLLFAWLQTLIFVNSPTHSLRLL